MSSAVRLLLILAFSCTSFGYQNPVYNRDFPDPFLLRVGTTMYAYSTNSAAGNIPVIRTTYPDVGSWTAVGDALPTLPSWARDGLTWAPSVLQRGSSYVLYYVARSKSLDCQCVGVATSSSPAGPFVDGSSAPFVCQKEKGGSIDPSYIVDDDGSLHLVWKNDGNSINVNVSIWGARLDGSGTKFVTDPTALISMDQPWETPCIEGPSMTKQGDGTYYLFYSANSYAGYAYAVGYAVCSTPNGPCHKPTFSPILAFYGNVWGPGGSEFFRDDNNGTWIVYHGWTAPWAANNGGARSLRVDRVHFNGTTAWIDGPTTNERSFP